MRLLLIEDDAALSRRLMARLTAEGYVVDLAEDGETGHYMGEDPAYVAIVLDLGLPIMDGMSVLSAWRREGLSTPVVLLTARDSWRDKVTGLRSGADDYLAKPFATEELLARLEAVIRRTGGQTESVLRLGPIELDLGRKQVARDGASLSLTPNEYRALAALAVHRGQVLTKAELAAQIWQEEIERDLNAVEVTIGRLRKKVGTGLIQTQRGHGYLID